MDFEFTESIEIAMPYAMSNPGKERKDIRLQNDMVGLPVNLKLFEDFDKGLEYFQNQFKAMKDSFTPFGVKWSFLIAVLSVPLDLNKYVADMIMEKYSLVYSNAFICKKPLCFGGVKQHKDLGSFMFTSVAGKCYCTFCILTIGDKMSVSCFSDEKVIPDPQNFMSIYVKKYKQVMGRLEVI